MLSDLQKIGVAPLPRSGQVSAVVQLSPESDEKGVAPETHELKQGLLEELHQSEMGSIKEEGIMEEIREEPVKKNGSNCSTKDKADRETEELKVEKENGDTERLANNKRTEIIDQEYPQNNENQREGITFKEEGQTEGAGINIHSEKVNEEAERKQQEKGEKQSNEFGSMDENAAMKNTKTKSRPLSIKEIWKEREEREKQLGLGSPDVNAKTSGKLVCRAGVPRLSIKGKMNTISSVGGSSLVTNLSESNLGHGTKYSADKVVTLSGMRVEDLKRLWEERGEKNIPSPRKKYSRPSLNLSGLLDLGTSAHSSSGTMKGEDERRDASRKLKQQLEILKPMFADMDNRQPSLIHAIVLSTKQYLTFAQTAASHIILEVRKNEVTNLCHEVGALMLEFARLYRLQDSSLEDLYDFCSEFIVKAEELVLKVNEVDLAGDKESIEFNSCGGLSADVAVVEQSCRNGGSKALLEQWRNKLVLQLVRPYSEHVKHITEFLTSVIAYIKQMGSQIPTNHTQVLLMYCQVSLSCPYGTARRDTHVSISAISNSRSRVCAP